MGYGVKLKVWGDYACFTRPEMKAERVSYDVLTPSAARGILEAIHWKPAIRWVIDKIYVINQIKFDNIRRNEVSSVISETKIKSAMSGKSIFLYQNSTADRQQRASLILKKVCYVIEAHFELTDKKGSSDTVEKHYNMAIRRMRQGQCYHQPYLGCREFPAFFELVETDIHSSHYNGQEIDLGWMLWDIDFENDMMPIFFRASMVNGVIDVNSLMKVR